MTPRTKLKTANALMLLGTLLIAFSFYRFLAAVSPAPYRMDLLAEELLKLGGPAALALIVGMGGFVWSMRVEKRHPSVQVSGTYLIRLAIFIVVFIPFVVGSF